MDTLTPRGGSEGYVGLLLFNGVYRLKHPGWPSRRRGGRQGPGTRRCITSAPLSPFSSLALGSAGDVAVCYASVAARSPSRGRLRGPPASHSRLRVDGATPPTRALRFVFCGGGVGARALPTRAPAPLWPPGSLHPRRNMDSAVNPMTHLEVRADDLRSSAVFPPFPGGASSGKGTSLGYQSPPRRSPCGGRPPLYSRCPSPFPRGRSPSRSP